MNPFTVRLLSYIVGLTILSFGACLTIKANIGVGAWDALNVGLSSTYGLTVGSWVFIVGILLIIINAFLQKKRPDLLAVITIILVGLLFDFWLLVVFSQWVIEAPYGFIVFAVGLIILAIGLSMYIQSNLALIPIDNLMYSIHKRTGVNLMIAKTIGEVTALVLALLFGGPIGVGTILITFLIGPLMQWFVPKIQRLQKKLEHVGHTTAILKPQK
jgi:uncharacterized membrane protein YczE